MSIDTVKNVYNSRAARPARAERAKLSEITTGIIISVISFLFLTLALWDVS